MRRVTGAAAVVVALLGWWFLWPLDLGGLTTYVSTYGVSMEPTFHTGDLAVLHQAGSYRVGDVVAYRSAELHAVVMHRIAAVQGGRFTFKGDNNAWLDPENPTEAAILGALTLRVPQGGIWLKRLASPIGLAVETFVLLAGGVLSRGAKVPRRGRRRSRRTGRGQGSPADWPLALRGMPAGLALAATGCGLVVLAAAALALVGWSGPVTVKPPPAPESAQRSVTFSYSARAPGTPVYDGGTVTSPDPVFRRVADTVDVRIHYVGEPATMRVEARLTAASGWHSTVLLAPERSLTRNPQDVVVHLDLAALDGRAQAASEVTGVPASQLTLAVVPVIKSGEGGTFEPVLKLTLAPLEMALADDPKSMVVVDPEATAAVGAPGPGSGAVVRGPAVPRTVPVLGVQVRVSAMRVGAVVLGPLAVVGLLAVAVLAYRRRPRGEPAQISRLYGSLLIAVQRLDLGSARAVADVASFVMLVRIAQRYGLLILHWDEGGTTTYAVCDDTTVYRYVPGAAALHSAQPGVSPGVTPATRIPRQRPAEVPPPHAEERRVERPTGPIVPRHAAHRAPASQAATASLALTPERWPSDWRLDRPR